MGLFEDILNFSNCDEIAVRDLGTGQIRYFTYQQFIHKISQFAFLLDAHAENVVAIVARNSFEFLACYYGILAAGKTAVLINSKNSNKIISELLEASKASLVFSDTHLIDGLKNYSLKDDSYLPQKNKIYESVGFDIQRDAVIMFTSGTTGDSKGVVRSYGAEYENAKRRMSPQFVNIKNISLLTTSLCHNHALSKAEAVFMEGHELVLMDDFNIEKYLSAIEKYKVTNLTATPSLFKLIVAYLQKNQSKSEFSSVKMINLGAEPLSKELIEDIEKIFNISRPKIISRYGGSEFGANIFGQHPLGLPTPISSVGFPRADVQVRIAKNQQLQIKTQSNLSRYLSSTAQDIFTDDGYFITNDLFRSDENGFYFFLGRVDDCIRCGAESLFPLEIEKVLNVYPGVSESIVVPINDLIKNQKPVAFLISENQNYCDVLNIKNFVIHQLRPNAHPRHIWFVQYFPRTNLGKVNRIELSRLAESLVRGEKPDIDYMIYSSLNETL
jgi:long-chain acyl-CoA synthetase